MKLLSWYICLFVFYDKFFPFSSLKFVVVTFQGDNIPAPLMTFEGANFPPELAREVSTHLIKV